MTKDEHNRKGIDETLARLSRLGDEADPDMEQKIAEYEKRKAAATSHGPEGTGKRNARRRETTKITSTLEKVSDREIEAAMEAAMAVFENNGAVVMLPAYDDAVVAAVSLEEWARLNNGDRCPKDHVATVAALVEVLPNSPLKTITETCSLLRELYGGVAAKWVVYYWIGQQLGAAVETVIDGQRNVSLVYTPWEVHRKLMALPRDSRPRHPLAPLLEFYWQERLPRPAGRFAEGTPFMPSQSGSLVQLSVLSDQHTHLPGFPDASTAPAEPAGRPPRPKSTEEIVEPSCASWMLWLFDRAGGSSKSQSHGAPWDLRLWVYALLHLPIEKRDGQWHKLSFPLEEVIGWLHPNGWSNQRRDWQKLPDALNKMRSLAYVPIPMIGHVAILYPSVIPTSSHDPSIEFTIRVPRAAAHGDRIIWPWLIAYGAKSSVLFRAYLAVTAWMGRSAHHGYSVTRLVAAPLYGSDGKLRRGKDGKIVRSDNRRIPNQLTRYVSELTDRDLTRMIGFDPDNNDDRHKARRAFERLHADTVIDLQRIGAGRNTRFAIFGPSRDQDLTRQGAPGAAQLLRRTTRNLIDPSTRANLAELATKATGPERRALVHALHAVPRDKLSTASLTAIVRKLEALPS